MLIFRYPNILISRVPAGPDFAEEKWAHILSVLPRDLDELVRATGRVGRFRNVRSGADLLRVMLAYGVNRRALQVSRGEIQGKGLGR